MPNYTLKLYRRKVISASLSEGTGTHVFEAADDLAAAKQAERVYAEGLSESTHALLLDESGRLVRQWGSLGA